MMSDQKENEEDVTAYQELERKLNSTDLRNKNNQDSTHSNPGPSGSKHDRATNSSNPTGISPQITLDRNQTEVALLEKIRNEKKEIKKQKNFTKLPAEPNVVAPRCVQENVGDDLSKKTEIHILCECEPNVAGAAVPTVTSFVNTPHETKNSSANYATSITANENVIIVIPKNKNVSEKATFTINNDDKSKAIQTDKQKGKRKIPKVGDERNNENVNNNNRFRDKAIKTSEEKINNDNKAPTKKPSLIPKLSKGTNVNRKNINYSSDKIQNASMDGFNLNSERDEPNSVRNSKIVPPKSYKKSTATHNELEADNITSNAMVSRMVGLQERLKATTSMLRQRMEVDRSTDQVSFELGNTTLDEIKLDTDTKSDVTVDDLYKNISQLRNTVTGLSESSSFSGQRKYIEKLFTNISEIKVVANKLGASRKESAKNQSSNNVKYESNEDTENNSDEIILAENEKIRKSPVNVKDNKIHITFLTQAGKKKKSDGDCGRSEEVQTDLSLGSKLTSASFNSGTGNTSKIKDTDSMDGVFIPTYEPPVNMEDEEESFGLDITITFPEIEHLISNGAESHLPVCVSDISAETLKKLKRCPKDFKLLMDFVEGKVSFQSGAGPANNFSISPDLKFIENVDYKKSDVISIKPSTECLYSSQMIPVENSSSKLKSSTKSLKSTDSELLFNVVNLPFLYRNPYSDDAAEPKSCVALRNEKLLSVTIVARQFFKSMPQIPSLTNIFENDLMENFSKTEPGKEKEKPTSGSKEKD